MRQARLRGMWRFGRASRWRSNYCFISAREALELKSGDKLLVVVRGKRVLVLQKPASHREATRGWPFLVFRTDIFERSAGVGSRGDSAVSPSSKATCSRHERFIYQLEAHPRYVALTDAVFSWVESAGHEAVTSTITMTELLVPAYRDGDENKVDESYGLLSTCPNLRWIEPGLETADLAARLRGTYRLPAPDALQAATALRAQVSGFITNDPVLPRIQDLDIAVLDQFL
jgi:predicted nucleic acid-binding protein